MTLYRPDADATRILVRAWDTIHANQPDKALRELALLPSSLPSVVNARGVCLLEKGQHQEALDRLRGLAFPEDSLTMNSDADPSWCANFCLALLRSDNQDGFHTYAPQLTPADHPAVQAIQALLAGPSQPTRGWKRLLTVFAAPAPVELPPDFPAGWPEQWLAAFTATSFPTQEHDAKTPLTVQPGYPEPVVVPPQTEQPLVSPKPGETGAREAAESKETASPVTADTPGNPQNENREIRVFISSTFRDMQKERDLLVKKVFPELRRKCAKRLVAFTEVDLRWGITEEQAAEGQVLPLCLAEIERSRPYFIGILGERYGWIPDAIQPELIEREPWLKEQVTNHVSVTELEILHGVLNNPKMANHAVFYFRDPAYTTHLNLSEDERREMVERDIPAEIQAYGLDEAGRRTAQRKEKLDALKERIRASDFPVTEPYSSPEELAEAVRKQFDELIDRLYPEQETPNPLIKERLAHDAHGRGKLFGCIDRPQHMDTLNIFANTTNHGGRGLVVTGESGSGKTALLAAWARDWQQANPEAFHFQHYFGATPDSSSPEAFLRRLLGELKLRFALPDPVPTTADDLRAALPLWLAQTSRDVQIILVLDGLNQVQGNEADHHLLFLPYHFPPHVTVVASTLEGTTLEALRKRAWQEYHLPLATEAEVDGMVATYLQKIGRHVDADGKPLQTPLRNQLAAAPGCRNPLFLRTVLEELRQFGSFEQLPARVAHYLEARDPKELFQKTICRWQEDFDSRDHGAPSHDLTRRALTCLWAASQGLQESEWLELLGGQGEDSESGDRQTLPLARSLWTPLFLALESHLTNQAGLYSFGHDYLRQAVDEMWLTTGKEQRAVHLTLAQYFEHHPNQREITSRKAAELSFQLYSAEAWDRQAACLTDIPLFFMLYGEETASQLTRFWLPLQKLGYDMGALYLAAYRTWIENSANTDDYNVASEIGEFLLENGKLSDAEFFLQRTLKVCERVLGPEHPNTLTSINNLADLLESKGDYVAAQSMYERALKARERVLGPEHPNTLTSINNLADLLRSKGDYGAAQPLLERCLEASERVLGPEHPDSLTKINNLAMVLKSKGDYVAAQPLFERALEARERVLGPEHRDTLKSVNNLAWLLESKGDYVAAQPLFERALKAFERVLGPEHPDTLTSIHNLASLLESKGDYGAAQPLYERALETRERVLGPEHPRTLTSVNNLAVLQATSKGDFVAAQPLYERALEARERVLGPEHPDTLTSINNLAVLLASKGDFVAAQPLFERALEARERVLGPEHPDTLASVINLANLLVRKGDYVAAQPLYERALEARERVLGPEHPDTQVTAKNLAALIANLRRLGSTSDGNKGPGYPRAKRRLLKF